MTVSSYLRDPRRPIVFVPVYFGYEKLIEGASFISELAGAEKSKESLFGLIRSLKALRRNFGKVYVNIGEPIEVEEVIEQCKPDWRDIDVQGEERLQGRAAAVATTYGEGKLVLLAFRAQHRAQTPVSFPFLFNALYWAMER